MSVNSHINQTQLAAVSGGGSFLDNLLSDIEKVVGSVVTVRGAFDKPKTPVETVPASPGGTGFSFPDPRRMMTAGATGGDFLIWGGIAVLLVAGVIYAIRK